MEKGKEVDLISIQVKKFAKKTFSRLHQTREEIMTEILADMKYAFSTSVCVIRVIVLLELVRNKDWGETLAYASQVIIYHLLDIYVFQRVFRNYHLVYVIYNFTELLLFSLCSNVLSNTFLLLFVFSIRSTVFIKRKNRNINLRLVVISALVYTLFHIAYNPNGYLTGRIGDFFLLVGKQISTNYFVNVFLTNVIVFREITNVRHVKCAVQLWIAFQVGHDVWCFLRMKERFKSHLSDLESMRIVNEKEQRMISRRLKRFFGSCISDIEPLLDDFSPKCQTSHQRELVKSCQFFKNAMINQLESIDDFKLMYKDRNLGSKFRKFNFITLLERTIGFVVSRYKKKKEKCPNLHLDISSVDRKSFPSCFCYGDEESVFGILFNTFWSGVGNSNSGEICISTYYDKSLQSIVIISKGNKVEKDEKEVKEIKDISSFGSYKEDDMGIGLYVAKTLVFALNGRCLIGTDPVENQSMFEIEVPLEFIPKKSNQTAIVDDTRFEEIEFCPATEKSVTSFIEEEEEKKEEEEEKEEEKEEKEEECFFVASKKDEKEEKEEEELENKHILSLFEKNYDKYVYLFPESINYFMLLILVFVAVIVLGLSKLVIFLCTACIVLRTIIVKILTSYEVCSRINALAIVEFILSILITILDPSKSNRVNILVGWLRISRIYPHFDRKLGIMGLGILFSYLLFEFLFGWVGIFVVDNEAILEHRWISEVYFLVSLNEWLNCLIDHRDYMEKLSMKRVKKLEILEKQRKTFIDSVANEVRNPFFCFDYYFDRLENSLHSHDRLKYKFQRRFDDTCDILRKMEEEYHYFEQRTDPGNTRYHI